NAFVELNVRAKLDLRHGDVFQPFSCPVDNAMDFVQIDGFGTSVTFSDHHDFGLFELHGAFLVMDVRQRMATACRLPCWTHGQKYSRDLNLRKKRAVFQPNGYPTLGTTLSIALGANIQHIVCHENEKFENTGKRPRPSSGAV